MAGEPVCPRIDRPLRVVFMGSPEFALPSLQALAVGPHELLAVVTQPDRPKGRGRTLQPPPIKTAALVAGAPVLQPERLTKSFAERELACLEADLFVVVAYGKILRRYVLDLPALGCLNVHGSLLPELRGAAPIQWAVLHGMERTGVSLMMLDEGMDTGDVLLTAETAIGSDETSGELHDRLAPLGGELLVRGLELLVQGRLLRKPQDHVGATVARMLTKKDGELDLSRPAREIHNLVRGLTPWPGAFVRAGKGPLRLFRSTLLEGDLANYPTDAAPGTILSTDQGRLVIACGEGAVGIGELQAPGKRRMVVRDYLRGRPLEPGQMLS